MPSLPAATGTEPSSKSRDLFRGPFFSSPFALVFALSLALYLFLLPPSLVRGGDTGELTAASYTLGIGHPSGYPIWCLLGRLFSLLPWGEVEWRYNLFSALCGALGAGLIAATAQLILEKDGASPRTRWAACGAGLLLAGFFFYGTQSLLAEIYAFAALEGSALLFFALRWKQKGDWRDLYTFTWLAGLSPLIHLSGVFLWPLLGVWALWKQKLTPARILTLIALWASGWIFIAYFPLRSGHFPTPPSAALDGYFYFPLDWGHPTTLAALKNHITAAQYSELLQPLGPVALLEKLAYFAQFLVLQYLWATPLILWGAIAAFKRGLGGILAAIFLFNVAVEIQYDVGDLSNFFFPAYLVMAVWMALGWFEFLGWMEKMGAKLAKGSVASVWNWRMRTLSTLLLLATVAAQWGIFAATVSGRGVLRTRDGALEATAAAEKLAYRAHKNLVPPVHGPQTVAALFVYDDTLWPFWYAKYVLGTAQHVETPWGRGLQKIYEGGKMADYVAQLKKSGPVVLAQWDEGTDARFPLVMLTPSGNLCEASNRALPPAAVPVTTKRRASTPGPHGLLSAKFRTASLWKGYDGVTSLSPASLAAFETDFSVQNPQAHSFLEVLMAPVDDFQDQKPAATQTNVARGSKETGNVLVSRQTRRLILPAGARPGEVLRAAVPLQIEATAPLGKYFVWTRIVDDKEDATTPWTKTDTVRLTSK